METHEGWEDVKDDTIGLFLEWYHNVRGRERREAEREVVGSVGGGYRGGLDKNVGRRGVVVMDWNRHMKGRDGYNRRAGEDIIDATRCVDL